MNCLLLTAFYDPQNDNNFLNFRLGQISHAILSHCILGAEGLGKGCLKITLIVSNLEWLTCLLLFIIVEFEKLLYSPDLKMVLFFLLQKCSKRIQCSNEFMFHSNMRCYVTQWPATRFCGAATPSSEKIAFDSPVKIAFRRFLFADDTNLFFSHIDFPD